MRRLRRIAAYGVCRDRDGRVLLVRAADSSANAARWLLPGGGVEHGEHPARTVAREIEEETGIRVAVRGIRDVVTDVELLPAEPAVRHHDRLVFDVEVTGGRLRDEVGGSTDRAMWAAPADLRGLPLMPFAARALAEPPTVTETAAETAAEAGAEAGAEARAGLLAASIDAKDGIPSHVQRFAAYGFVTDPAGRVLLTRISAGYPGAGRWHLPGGGTDFGEAASVGLLRELVEETDQRGRITGLIGVSHRHQVDALGPELIPIDWHGVRVVFAARVDAPTSPRVIDNGGSTDLASWFFTDEALLLPLTEVAREAVTLGNPR